MKKTDLTGNDVTRFTASGMAAFLPGMIYLQEIIAEQMQRSIEQMKRELAMFQQMDQGVVAKRGRSAGVKEAGPRRKSGWPEGEEERRAEMARRKAVGEAKKKLHPRDKRHPGHEAWRETMRVAQNKRWASMTPAQQKAQRRKTSQARKTQAATARGAVEELRATA